jgi:hypothetical protein
VVAEVGVHDDNEVPRSELQAVDVSCSEAKFASSWLEEHVWAVGFDELVGYNLGAVWGAIVDDNKFPVEVATGRQAG